MNLLRRVEGRDLRTWLSVLHHQTGKGFRVSGNVANARMKLFQHSGQQVESEPDGSIQTVGAIIPANTHVITNLHPEKAAIPTHKPPRGLKRIYYRLRARLLFAWGVIFPTLTDEQIAEKLQAKKDAVTIKQVLGDANRAWHLISGRLKDLTYYQKLRDGTDKAVKIKQVNCDVCAYDWDDVTHTGGNQIIFHIDMRRGRLPEGVHLKRDLLSQDTIDELNYTLEHPVHGWADHEGGLIKMMRSGNNGISTFISIQDMWEAMPKNSPLLSFPVGIGENSQHYHKDLDDCPHLLIVGASKQGKSNMINGILCTYLYRGLKPNQVQFVLFDCKAGLEFSFFDGIPHLFKNEGIPGIIEDLDQAIPAMNSLLWEMKSRMEIIREDGCKSLHDYNQKRRGANRIPELIVAFDDFIALSLMYGKKADEPLTLLSSQGRAAGIYIILGAQYPKSDQFPSIALINFPVVIAFRLKPGASRSILNSQAATELICRGRGIFQDFDQDHEVQSPRISDSTIRECVQAAITGHKVREASRIDIEEVLAYGLEHMGGMLDFRKLYVAFKDKKLSQPKLKMMLREADEQVYDVKGTMYLVTMKKGYPRRMELYDANTDVKA